MSRKSKVWRTWNVEATAEKRPLYNLAGKRIWVPGHLGMLESAIMRRLATETSTTLWVARRDLDLRRQSDVEDWMSGQRPDAIINVVNLVESHLLVVRSRYHN